jgi:hypothetical protein
MGNMLVRHYERTDMLGAHTNARETRTRITLPCEPWESGVEQPQRKPTPPQPSRRRTLGDEIVEVLREGYCELSFQDLRLITAEGEGMLRIVLSDLTSKGRIKSRRQGKHGQAFYRA